jgi:hypothetical protein
MRAEEAQLFGEPAERLYQRVELAAGKEFVEAAEPGQDALLHLAADLDVIDEEQIGSGTVGLGADEQRADRFSNEQIVRVCYIDKMQG